MRGIRILLVVAGVTGLLTSGCAGTPTAAARYEIDHERVARVERAARAYGTQVIWVNYPTKRVEAAK
jgi:LmbE family N-acetylglucosaminyl deacetylase